MANTSEPIPHLLKTESGSFYVLHCTPATADELRLVCGVYIRLLKNARP